MTELLSKQPRAREELIDLVAQFERMGLTVAGSYRREKAIVGDLDILVPPEGMFQKMIEVFNTLFRYEQARGGGMKSEGAILYKGAPLVLNLWNVPTPSAWAGMLLFATGPFDLNIMMRAKAQQKEWKLSQYGLFTSGVMSQEDIRQIDDGEHEEQIFQLLETSYLTPPERENWRNRLIKIPKKNVVSVPSSNGVDQYLVEIADGKAVTCECKGFAYRARCRHLAEAERQWARTQKSTPKDA